MFQPAINKQPVKLTQRVLATGFAALLATSALLSERAAAVTASGTETVRHFYDTLLTTMQNGERLGQKGRYAKLEPVIRQTFDVSFMARLAVGPAWSGLTAVQQQQLTDAFERYIAATYADRFDSYAGEKLQVTGEQSAPSGTIVASRLVKSNGEPVAINYLMRQTGSGWQISDVYLDGTISEVATRRSEFSSILQKKGVDGLIATLNRKAEMLMTTASN
jgi:phospholipid transport system substrate-binding protein